MEKKFFFNGLKAFFFIVAGAGAGEKNTWSRSWSKMDRLRNTGVDCVVDPDPHGSGTFAWIRIRMDLVLLPGSGSGILVLDPDPAKSERVYYCEFWTVCTIGQ